MSEEYCICKYCDIIVEDECTQRCQSRSNTELDRHPLSDYHSLVGKVLNQTECWVCSQVPQGQSNSGLVPYTLTLDEVLKLHGVKGGGDR